MIGKIQNAFGKMLIFLVMLSLCLILPRPEMKLCDALRSFVDRGQEQEHAEVLSVDHRRNRNI